MSMISPLGVLIAEHTQRLYLSCWREFESSCTELGLDAIQPRNDVAAIQVLNYFVACAKRGLKINALRMRKAAIRRAYLLSGFADPTAHEDTRAFLAGLAASCKNHPTRPANKDDVAVLLDACAPSSSTRPAILRALRDRAMVLLTNTGPLRKRQIAMVRAENCIFLREGVAIAGVRKDGRPLVVRRNGRRGPCAVRALEEWLAAAHIVYGPIFRGVDSGGRVQITALARSHTSRILRTIFEKAGIEGAGTLPLTLGFRTTAFGERISKFQILRQAEISVHTREPAAAQWGVRPPEIITDAIYPTECKY